MSFKPIASDQAGVNTHKQIALGINQRRRLSQTFAFLAAAFFLSVLLSLQAQPNVTTVPQNGASGVPVNTPLVFTFTEPMNPMLTTVSLLNQTSPLNPVQVSQVWSVNNTVLTCTPIPPSFAPNSQIFWIVDGESATGDPMSGSDFGYFFTASSSGGETGTGTNKLTGFVAAITHKYQQLSDTAIAPHPDFPYNFTAITTLSSNRSATAITLTTPTGASLDLSRNPLARELWYLFDTQLSLTDFQIEFPAGGYQFFVQAAASNQTVTVSMPATSAQPNTPQISNFLAFQNVISNQSFQLTWHPFSGATAGDWIQVEIPDANVSSPDVGRPGSLSATATSFTVPANRLKAASNYTATLTFYKLNYASNTTFTTTAYRATATDFTIYTAGSTIPPQVTNPGFIGGKFGFDVAFAPGQSVTAYYSSNLLAGQWFPLLTTNGTPPVRITDGRSSTNRVMFYRVELGN